MLPSTPPGQFLSAMSSSSGSEWDPVRGWLATDAGTAVDVQEAAAASLLLGRRLREVSEMMSSAAPQVPKLRDSPFQSQDSKPPVDLISGILLKAPSAVQALTTAGGKTKFWDFKPRHRGTTLKPGTMKIPKPRRPSPSLPTTNPRLEIWITKDGVCVCASFVI
jgi:hypothetical protein